MFFKAKPNLPTDEKARIEFHLSQIADVIGFERMLLPVLDSGLLLRSPQTASIEQMIETVGNHLSHDVGGIQVEAIPTAPEKCGSGG
ncbi:MAG: hypothetical protein AB8B55_20455 [Mariniblastus sp.]